MPSEVSDLNAERERLEKKKEGGDPPRKLEGWESLLRRTGYRAEVAPTVANAITILTKSDAWRGVLSWNAMACRIQLLKQPPWHAIDAPVGARAPEWWTDELATTTRAWCERMHDVAFAKDVMHEAARIAAGTATHHPLQECLSAFVWDGVKRIDTWLTDYVRVPDSPYVRSVGRKWLISAVARAFEPGCKADYALIIEGGQRAGKSKIFEALCPNREWFLDTDVELGSKDSYHAISNKWIVELRELGSLSRGESDRVKGFMSTRVDTYCPRYGRTAIDQPRTCIFGGTVNPPYDYLKDESGGDRWWPVRTTATRLDRLDVSLLVGARPQLWAEAVAAYKSGEAWHFTASGDIQAAAIEQEARRREDPWEARLAPLLASPKRQQRGVTVAELLIPAMGEARALGASVADNMRIARTLQALGWVISETPTINGKRTKLYRPAEHLGVTEINEAIPTKPGKNKNR